MSSQQPPGSGPSEAELQAYLSQLREAPVTDLVAQAVAMLVNAAQVKLGLPDGRTLIDVTAAVVQAAGDRIDGGFRQEVESIVKQLQMAQVEAEQHLAPGAAQASEADATTAEGEAGAEDAVPPAEPPRAAPPPPSGTQPPQGGGGSRLWVPPGAK